MLGFFFFLALCFIIFVPYLIGAIPFGFIIAKKQNKDLTKLGSGNIGATNVTRQFSGKLGALTLFLDFSKGYFMVVFSVAIFHLLILYNPLYFDHLFAIAYISMFFVVLGHIFSPYIHFKGGKGVSTAGGCILALSPSLFLVALVIILLIFLIYHIVSLASLMVAGAIGMLGYIPWLNFYYLQLMNHNPYFANIEGLILNPYWSVLGTSIVLTCIAILVIVKHKSNIDRLLNLKERIFQVGKDELTQERYKKPKQEL